MQRPLTCRGLNFELFESLTPYYTVRSRNAALQVYRTKRKVSRTLFFLRVSALELRKTSSTLISYPLRLFCSRIILIDAGKEEGTHLVGKNEFISRRKTRNRLVCDQNVGNDWIVNSDGDGCSNHPWTAHTELHPLQGECSVPELFHCSNNVFTF